MTRLPLGLLWIAAVVSLLALVWRMAFDVPGHGMVLRDHPSGVWAALAFDLAHGTFYRPLISEIGYGGTRYFPLHIVAHAALIRLGLGVGVAGYVLEWSTLAGLVAGLVVLLRRFGARSALAIPLSLLALSSVPMFQAELSIRGDLLPATLNIWALALIAAQERRHPRAAGVLFALAFLAKLTTVFGAAAALLWLWRQDERTCAARLLLAAAGTAGLGLFFAMWASHGHFIESMRACMTGGMNWQWALTMPRLLLAYYPACDLVSLLAVVAAMVVRGRAGLFEMPALLVILSGFMTLLILSSPGTATNHLLDLDLALILFMGVEAARGRPGGAMLTGVAALVAMIAAGRGLQEERSPSQSALMKQVVADLGSPSEGPILSENPWVSILAQERPYMLDAFTFRIIAARDARIRADLAEKLDARFFRAVVLKLPSSEQSPWGRWYGEVHYGDGFVPRLRQNYDLVGFYSVPGCSHYIFRPKGRGKPLTTTFW